MEDTQARVCDLLRCGEAASPHLDENITSPRRLTGDSPSRQGQREQNEQQDRPQPRGSCALLLKQPRGFEL